MTCPFLHVYGPPRDQRLVKLPVTLCPTHRVDMLPERAIKGQCVELRVELREGEKLTGRKVREDVEENLGGKVEEGGSRGGRWVLW